MASFVALAAAWLAPTDVAAQEHRLVEPEDPGPHIDLARPAIWAGIGPASLNAGARLEIPIVPGGLVTNIDDELSLAPGVAFAFANFHHYHDSTQHSHAAFAAGPLLVAQWNFYLNRRWSIYPELGAVVMIGRFAAWPYNHDAYVNVDPVIGFGARYHVSDRLSVTMGANWPFGLQAGLAF